MIPTSCTLAFTHRLRPIRQLLLNCSDACVNTPPRNGEMIVNLYVSHILQSESSCVATRLLLWLGKERTAKILHYFPHEDIGRTRS